MLRSPRSAFAAALACMLLAACADPTRSTRSLDPRLALDDGVAEEMPDSGAHVAWPSDGPAAGEARGFALLATASVAPTIRIGVVQQASAIALGSAGAFEIRDKANGLVLASGSNAAATVTLASVVESYYRLQVTCGSAAAVATRKAAAEALGHTTFTEYYAAGGCTRLYLGQFAPPPANTFAARTAYRNLVISQGLAATDAFWRVVSLGSSAYSVALGGKTVTSVNPVIVVSPTGLVTIGGATYRGTGEARMNGAGSLAGIDQLPVEQYLYGVLPRELGPIQYPEPEAQKAQAVAARTYALANLGRRSSDGYDLRATSDDQVYGGYGAEHPVSNAAVDATAGIVATYGGNLIDALFSSTSGGHTADSEESFANPIPYLRGVPDAERGEALDHVPTLEVFRASASPTSLRAMKEGDFESDWAHYHRWTFEWTMDEISRVLSAWQQQPVGRVRAIEVLERGPSGRALRVRYDTDAGTFYSTKDGTRSALRYLNATNVATNLPSTLFFVEPVVDPPTKEVTGYRVYGAGFGHGVGLAQTGAVGMAQKGHTYQEILEQYYRGVELTSWY